MKLTAMEQYVFDTIKPHLPTKTTELMEVIKMDNPNTNLYMKKLSKKGYVRQIKGKRCIDAATWELV